MMWIPWRELHLHLPCGGALVVFCVIVWWGLRHLGIEILMHLISQFLFVNYSWGLIDPLGQLRFNGEVLTWKNLANRDAPSSSLLVSGKL